jgi:hypothetical protein
MLESVSVSGLIESMRYNGGHSTKQSSTVTMAVTHKFATEVANLIEDYQKKGIEPEEGLIRLELIAHYDNGRVEFIISDEEERPDDTEAGEQIIDDLTDDLDSVDLETEEDTEEESSD